MTNETTTPFHITDHEQLDDAIAYCETRATPLIDKYGSCLNFVLIPITPVQAHDMFREAMAHDAYNMYLKAQHNNDGKKCTWK